MRTALPASQADQHLKRAGRSKARHQGSRRGHLARQLHALRSRILRSGAENPATSRQPVRHEVVTHVLGTTCHLCVQAGHQKNGTRSRDSNCGSDSCQCVPEIGNVALCEMIHFASFGFVPAFMSYTALACWKSDTYVLNFRSTLTCLRFG